MWRESDLQRSWHDDERDVHVLKLYGGGWYVVRLGSGEIRQEQVELFDTPEEAMVWADGSWEDDFGD